MAKYQITLEDNEERGGVNISIHGSSTADSKAHKLAIALAQQARLIALIPAPESLHALAGCECDICQAMREKAVLNPTLH